MPIFEEFDDDEVVVDTDAPDDAEIDVNTLLDFFNDIRDEDDEGQSGFSRHSSGLRDEKSASIPLSISMGMVNEIH